MWKALLLLCFVWAGSFTRAILPLSPLLVRTAKPTRLQFSTSELSGVRYWTLFFAFIARSIINRLIGRRALVVSQTPDGLHALADASAVSLVMPLGCTDAELSKYADASGADKAETIDHPLHSLLFLSAVTEPAMLLLLAKLDCPVDAVGSVNTRNRFEAVEPKLLREMLRSSVKGHAGPADLEVRARLEDRVQMVKRGWEVTVVVELCSGKTVLYRQSFAFLQSHKHLTPPPVQAETKEDAGQTKQAKDAGSAKFSMDTSDPGRWASLSKDYNPIHFLRLAAKLFGFRARLAHGNHVLAKAITALDESDKARSTRPTALSVDLKRPVFLPSDLEVSEVSRGEPGCTIEVGSGEKVQVVGRY